jgi:hypothetical protein
MKNIAITLAKTAAGTFCLVGSPRVKSSKVCGMATNISNRDRTRTLFLQIMLFDLLTIGKTPLDKKIRENSREGKDTI